MKGTGVIESISAIPPVEERDQKEECSVMRLFSSLSPVAGERAG